MDLVALMDRAHYVWIMGAVLVAAVLIPYELLFSKRKPAMSGYTAGAIALGALLWPIFLVSFALDWWRDRRPPPAE